ncbi:MAG: hypothetical protein ACAI43_08630 [Phycisphaerae bacterium]|nr:hypothetical protein [Tepidisphaeraceae bacterium]
MKTLLILVLLLALGGGAYLSKPSEASFKEMIRKKMEGEKDDLVGYVMHFGKGKADRFLEGCTFKDRVLWLTVEHNGKKIYWGAFNSWFSSDLTIEKATN